MLIDANELVDMGPVADKPTLRLARYKERYFRVDENVLVAAKQKLAGDLSCYATHSPTLISGVDRFLALVEGPTEQKRQVRAIADVDASGIARPLARLIKPIVSRPRRF